MRDESLYAPKGRRPSAFGAAENAAKRGAQRVRQGVFRLEMALEQKLPAELHAFGHHDSGVVTLAPPIENHQAAFEFAFGALPVIGRAV